MPEPRGAPWTASEIEAAVARYFFMLRAQLADEPYVKLRENEKVQAATRRSHGSVERKFQNISAVLMELGAGDFVHGYVPLGNAQQALRDAVAERWRAEPEIEARMRAAAMEPVTAGRFDLVWSRPPKVMVEPTLFGRRRTPVRTDFLKLDADNRELGHAGELAVVNLERQTLQDQGLDRLARRVEHVSQTQGDGLGFDVLSFAPDGQEKYIEVKTTRKQKEFPFLVTRNEVEFSIEEKERFHLYRVFNFGRSQAGLFATVGPLNQTCILAPTVYSAKTVI